MTLKKISLIAGIVAAVAAVIGLIWMANPDSGSTTIEASGGGNAAGGDLNDNDVIGFCPEARIETNSSCLMFLTDEANSDAEVEVELNKQNDEPPAGRGPWPFVVLHDDDLGLWIRTGPETTDRRHDLALGRTIVYVSCVVRNDFDADPARQVGGLWYRVHWPEIADPDDYYAFGGYLTPVGHNGDVPEC